MITFRVKGTPRPSRYIKTRFGGQAVAPEVKYWRGVVAKAAAPFKPPAPIDGPIRVEFIFYLPRPDTKAQRPYPIMRGEGDNDNLQKPAQDALTQEGFWVDDARIVSSRVSKLYATEGEPCGLRVTINQIPTTANK